ncbi:LysR family transcriptional regulator [Roseibium sp.]|uniref:LysR family transcriptional regulator n=1 Tax=Roseibium sp. TaxID=1936156 RepID=UPI003BACA283
MELHQLRYFVAVAETLNFTRAAEQCGVSQPSLTKAIKKLEDEFGGPLFRREGRRTHLTELGRAILPRLEQALALTEFAQKDALDFQNLRNSTLTLGCMCTIAPESLMSLIDFFQREAPELKLCLREGSGQKVVDMLQDGEIDIALAALPAYADDLSATPLFTEKYVITFPQGHQFAQLDEVPLQALDGERYLERINCEYLTFLEAAGFKDDGSVDSRFKSEHESWIQAMVIAGLGCAVMPQSLASHPQLHKRPLVDPDIERTISVITKRGRRHTPVVDLFVRLCRSIDWSDFGKPHQNKNAVAPQTA